MVPDCLAAVIPMFTVGVLKLLYGHNRFPYVKMELTVNRERSK